MNLSWRTRFWLGCAVGAFLFGILVSDAQSADKARIQEAISRGKDYLLRSRNSGAVGSLVSYSLIRTGVDKNNPDIQRSVQEIVAKCATGTYGAPSHGNYEAGVDAMLLEAVDSETYRPQLELIAKYLIARQRPHGGWFYNTEFGGVGEYGDTSITQYAVLGLWAAQRAGIEIPIEVWQKAARWLTSTQHPDAGFGYHPAEVFAQNPVVSMGTMTAAGTGSILVIRYILFTDIEPDEVRPTAPVPPLVPPRKFGLLERLPEDREPIASAKPKPAAGPSVSAATLDKAARAGVRWLGEHFADQGALQLYANYYFYGIERVAALLDSDKIGPHDWYNEGAEILLLRQAADGSWQDSCGAAPATALTLLFLTKATAAAVHKPPKKSPMVGGGLLIGGRGLPDDLNAVQAKAGEVGKRKLHGPVDGLLAELEKSSGAKVDAVQAAVVEAVQLDHPEELVGQVDRLKKLAGDTRVEVRRTAMWALGRTGNVSVAPYLIRGLSDAEENVVREASSGLCILSRRPNGCGLPPDPTDGLKEGASDDEYAVHLADWKKTCTRLWTEWYMKVRPYDERDDQTTLKRKP